MREKNGLVCDNCKSFSEYGAKNIKDWVITTGRAPVSKVINETNFITIEFCSETCKDQYYDTVVNSAPVVHE